MTDKHLSAIADAAVGLSTSAEVFEAIIDAVERTTVFMVHIGIQSFEHRREERGWLWPWEAYQVWRLRRFLRCHPPKNPRE